MTSIYESFYTPVWLDIPATSGLHKMSSDIFNHEHDGSTDYTGDHSHTIMSGDHGPDPTSDAGTHTHVVTADAPTDLDAWHTEGLAEITKLTCDTNAVELLFPLYLSAGTIVLERRAKWQAKGAQDGIHFYLVKRDESAANSAWITVDDFIAVDQGAPYSITVTSAPLVSAFVLEANFSYAIIAKSIVAVSGVHLFSVGLKVCRRQ